MNSKLIRAELYEDDYQFNEQEYKEFHLVQSDPYWKVRSLCYLLSLNIFGEKSELIRRSQTLFFNNYLHKKPSTSKLREVAVADLEMIVSTLKCKSGKFDDVAQIELPYEDEDIIDEKVTNFKFPWEIIPELQRMNKTLSYGEIYKGITVLMRNSMLFYNHYSVDDYINGVVALPYTPQMLDYFSPPQLYCIVKNLGMKHTCDSDLRPSAIDMLKQKLYDLYYAVEDNPRLHGVTMCQGQFEECSNLSSQFCQNNMCKLCCQNMQHKKPCHVHDTFEQFTRYKLRNLYHFEEVKNFDKTRTLRLYSRRMIRRYQVEQIFDGLNVEWDKLKVYHHHSAHKIQYIYLTFLTQEDAARVYNDRHIYELKMEKEDVQIECMNEGLWKKLEFFKEPENVIVIIKPLSTLEIVEELPKGADYLKTLHTLVQTITQLKYGSYNIDSDVNPVNQQPCYRHTFVELPNKEYVDQIYNAQPFFGCLVAHKLSHISYLPFVRYHKNLCLQCNNKKEPNCIHDMCKDCCAKQKYGIIECPCSFSLQQSIDDQRQDIIKQDAGKEEILCEKCDIERNPGCKNNLCDGCCAIQAIKKSCPIHESSIYLRDLVELKPHKLARRMLQVVGEINLKFRADVINGRYDWFRPIHNCHIQNGMIKANKDLQEIKDNGSLIRTTANSKTKREGRLLTFQQQQEITIWTDINHKTIEFVDKKGDSCIQYVYGEENCQKKNHKWEKNSINNYRMYTEQEYLKLINSPCLKAQLQNNFEILILGLDSKGFSPREILQDVYSKLVSNVGEIQPQNIMMIDGETVKSEIYQSPAYMTVANIDENFKTMGRIIAVKFNNVLDALALLTGDVSINVPLQDSTTGKPIVYPSAQLQKNLIEADLNQVNFNYQNAGPCFAEMNKEIQQQQNVLSNLVAQSNQNNNNNRGKKGGKNNNNKRPNNNKGGPNPNKKQKK